MITILPNLGDGRPVINGMRGKTGNGKDADEGKNATFVIGVASSKSCTRNE